MKFYRLDCRRMADRQEAHGYLARALELPDYYGRNLDALYDCLTEMGPCAVALEHARALASQGDYAARLVAVFRDAAEANPNLRLYRLL